MDLEGCLIPKAGQHRCGGIPRFVHKNRKNPAEWQAVLGSQLSLNFWLKEEQPVAFYLSGVSFKRTPQCIQALDAEKPKVMLVDNILKFLQHTEQSWFSKEWQNQQEWAGTIVTE